MGCLYSHQDQNNATTVDAIDQKRSRASRKFSWDRREKVIIKDFTIEGLKGETMCRLPGSVDGQQFGIENCQDCNIYIYDNSSAVSVENCINCRIFLGPVKSSVYLRGCSECAVAVVCQQMRIKGCSKLDLFICSATGPMVESSSGLTFSCLQYYYNTLKDQFHRAQLSVYNNSWGKITDDYAKGNSSNFRVMTENVRVDLLVPSSTDFCAEVGASSDPDRSVVQYVPGIRKAPKNMSCLVIFFSDGMSHDRAHAFIKRMKKLHRECSLVQNREVYMQEGDAEQVFGTDSYAMAVKQGPVIGLEYSGPQSCQACHGSLISVSKGSTGLVYVSSSSETAEWQVEAFYRFTERHVTDFMPQRVSSFKR